MKNTFMLAAVGVMLFTACGKSGSGPVIAAKSQVKIHYTLKVDGKVVDSSKDKAPLSYVQGSGQIIPGLEEQLMGLKAGAKKEVTVSPEKGYGVHNPKMVQKVPKASFGDTAKLKVGAMVAGQVAGRRFQAKVIEIGAKDVTLDLNHPLAGKTLHFSIEVIAVEPAAA